MPDQEPITKEFLLSALQQIEMRLEARIDQNLTQRFQESDERFEKRFQESEERFEKRFQESEERLEKRFQEFEQKLDVKFEQLSETFDIKLERMETKLLTAFHGWASPMDMRTRRNTNDIHEFDQRLVLIEERIARLEQQPTQFRQ